MTHKHTDGHECEYCNASKEEMKQKENSMIEKHGWYAHFIINEPDLPYNTNVHTHGLKESLDHPDLQICMGMSPATCHSILINAIEDNIKQGIKFEPGSKYGNIIKPAPGYKGIEYKVLFLEAEEGGRTVLRMIFPDTDGGFDGPMSKQLEGCKIPEGLKLSA